MELRCPKCGKALSAGENAAGKIGVCPVCGTRIRFPAKSVDSLEEFLERQRQIKPPPAPLVPQRVVFEAPLYSRALIRGTNLLPFVGVAVVAFLLGFFAGKEYFEWKLTSSMSGIVEAFGR